MLIPDYLAIGTLVILILGYMARVYPERRAHRQAGGALFLAALRNPPVPIETASKRICGQGIRFVEPRPNDRPKPFSR
jgi:hypothetical protein